MTKFGRTNKSLNQLTEEAVSEAIADAQVTVDDIDLVVFANAVGGLLQGQEMIRGQVALRNTGLLGKPVFNVENACASGSSAVALARMAIRSAAARTVLVIGAEKLAVADKRAVFAAIGSARDVRCADADDPDSGRSPFMDIYAKESLEYSKLSGATSEDFAAVSVKNRSHGALNPNAQFASTITVAEVMNSRVIVDPLRLLMCSPISDGAAALVLTSSSGVGSGPAIKLRACAIVSGTDRSDDLPSASARAAKLAYEESGIGPDDLNVAEVHDAVAPAELMAYEDLLLAPKGGGVELMRSGVTRLGGALPINVSGGLIARGHPIGATGCAQLVELVGQLRGVNGSRQVDGATTALSHNVGGWLGNDGAVACVTILTREGSL